MAGGQDIPIAFRDKTNQEFALDAGCIGHAVANGVLEQLPSGSNISVVTLRKARNSPLHGHRHSITVSRYTDLLEGHGFHITKRTQKVIEFTHPELDTPVYLKTNVSGEPTVHAPLVIHPGLARILGAPSDQDGWSIDSKHYHMSNMTAFPRHVHTGQRATHFGSAISFENEKSLGNFILTLLSVQGLTGQLEIDEDGGSIDLPETERLALRNSRIGQGRYRYDLIELWGACSITNVQDPAVLIASHIKGWKASDNRERLDKYNGFLLVPNLDRLFDIGFITFRDDGRIILSSKISKETLKALGVDESLRLRKIHPENVDYLRWHRKYRFLGQNRYTSI